MIKYIAFNAHDYKHSLYLYEERKWDVSAIEIISDDNIWVDTINDVLTNIWRRHIFTNEFEFSIFEPNTNILLRFVIFFLDKRYKLETTNELTLYKFKKPNIEP